MNSMEIDGLLSLFGQDMPAYHYFKDKYALQLAGWYAGEGKKVAEFKRSRFAGLLQKGVLKDHCAKQGILRAAELLEHPSGQGWTFRQSLDVWGSDDDWGWTQVSRPGKSLVLRLDFGDEHGKLARKMRVGNAIEQLEWRNHMHADENHNLAWVRMDLDWETGEVLIEEIQNDWLRNARNWIQKEADQPNRGWYRLAKKSVRKNDGRFLMYHREILEPLEKIWSEAMLCAALEFIRDRLGLYTVYMHTPGCGARLKDIRYQMPPFSLYQDLPRRFCFEATDKAPVFLSRAWGKLQTENDAARRARLAKPFAFWRMEL